PYRARSRRRRTAAPWLRMCSGRWQELWSWCDLHSEKLLRSGGQPFRRDAVMREDLNLTAGDGVLVWQADDLQRLVDAALHQSGGARLAQPAVHAMLLDRDQRAAVVRRVE